MSTYKIVRHYLHEHIDLPGMGGLTLKEAQEHCHDPETSSRTCTSKTAKAHTDAMGPWFDGYTEE